jgi:hypothetical protein
MRVETEIEETELESDSGRPVNGLLVTCMHCGHSVEVFGTSGASARRGAVMLKEECPEGGENYYVVNWDG